MEEENAVLSQDTIKKPIGEGGETVLHQFLRQIFTDLREQGLCVTGLGEDLPQLYLLFTPRPVSNSVSSCFVPSEVEPPTGAVRGPSPSDNATLGGTDIWSRVPFPFNDDAAAVNDATVFVLVRPLLSAGSKHVVYMLEREGGSSHFWEAGDLVSRRIMTLINGERTVAELARLATVDISIARLCMAELARIGAVRAVSAPIFLHPTSVQGDLAELFSVPGYVGLPRLLRLATDETLRNACFESVLSQSTIRRRLHVDDPDRLILTVLQVYSKLCASSYLSLTFLLASTQHIAEILVSPSSKESKNSSLPCISLLRLVQFGEVNNLIHRLHCYPVIDALASKSPPISDPATLDTQLWTYLCDQMMDGVQSVDTLVYEASAQAMKAISTTTAPDKRAVGRFGYGSVVSVRPPATTLPDAVVAFTARLLREKAEGDRRQPDGKCVWTTCLSETNSRASRDKASDPTTTPPTNRHVNSGGPSRSKCDQPLPLSYGSQLFKKNQVIHSIHTLWH
ncbi:unnamed protein product [Mesocestoides corti]|nr:unnamed protein product [Mesocestoides corti]